MTPPRRLTALVGALALVLSGLVALTTAAPAGAVAVPRAPYRFTSTIEPYTDYVPQDSCDATPRHGTTEFGNMLTRVYPGTTWSSYRPCDGSVSEHHEFRAIDWMVSARNATQRAEGYAVVNWLLATDRFGNKYAMARRLGVMYLIWNSRMWGMWDGRWQEYDGCLHGAMRKAVNDNTCHRTHVHISLSWNGARGLTSYWTNGVWRTDFGPCVARGKKYAARWSHRNFTPCA